MSTCNGQGVNRRDGSKHCEDDAGELHDLEKAEGRVGKNVVVGELQWADAGRLEIYAYSGFETLACLAPPKAIR